MLEVTTSREALAARYRDAYARSEQHQIAWIDCVLEMAAVLYQARETFGDDNNAFAYWIVDSDLGFHNDHARAALISMGRNMQISRIVLQETKSRSLRLIWEDEIRPRLGGVGSAAITPPPPEPKSDSAPNPVDQPPTEQTAVPQNGETETEIAPPPPARNLGRSKLRDLPDAPRIAPFLSHDTAANLGRIKPEKTRRAIWNLLCEAIDNGIYGGPTKTVVSLDKLNIRLVLPWLSPSDASHLELGFNLMRAEDRALIRSRIFPLVLENPDVRTNPKSLGDLARKSRVAVEVAERAATAAVKHTAAIAKMPIDQEPIVAYGRPIWPPIGPVRYSYLEARSACWFADYFFGIIRSDTPTGIAMTARHLIKYLRPVAPGIEAAVDAIFDAYQENPQGEKKFPIVPANYFTGASDA